MRSVLLVGAGQLGSRYLQGLAKTTLDLRIIVVEPSANATALARERLLLVSSSNSAHKIEWNETIKAVSRTFPVDIAIVCTSAYGRVDLIAEVNRSLEPKYWILEKVLAQSTLDLGRIASITHQSAGAWVNTPRRAMSWYRGLKNQLKCSSPLKVVKSGALWGLACNSIHFIDLVAWWTSESLVSVDLSGLSQDWFVSKRSGFYEVTGDLIATYSGGSVLTLRSDPRAQDDHLNVETSRGVVWAVDESTGVASSTEGTEVLGQLEYQSVSTPRLVTGILEHGSCELPTLEESARMHVIFLDAMLKHWNDSRGLNDTHVPIT